MKKENNRKAGVQTRLKVQKAKRNQGRQRFLRTRMWINTLISYFEKDRGKIPDNIGDKIIIGNNLYTTKAYMTSVVQITALSLETPETLLECIIDRLRGAGSAAVVDMVIKNESMDVSLEETGMRSRIEMWERSLTREDISDNDKEVAARCIYTVDEIRGGIRPLRSRIYLEIRERTGSQLIYAEKEIFKYLKSIGASFKPVMSDIKDTLEYIALASNRRTKAIKDVKTVINSERTLAQLLPNTDGYNGSVGLWLGVNILNNSHFLLDLENITSARNMLFVAPSGVGKTVFSINLGASAREVGWAVCGMDIKGNELTNFAKATDGYIVSVRPHAIEYINSFRLHADDVPEGEAETYFKSRIEFSKNMMKTLSGLAEDKSLSNEMDEFLEEFLTSVYIGLGVLGTNKNTWMLADELTPFTVYEMLTAFANSQVQARYPHVAIPVLLSLKMYWTKEGSKSYAFIKEFDYRSILESDTLIFDFGLLQDGSGTAVDVTLFKLRFDFMSRLNSEYVAYKHAKGKRVLKILEEAQVATSSIRDNYVREWTLNRAQGQSTILITNSIKALVEEESYKPIIENVRALFIGKLMPEALEEVISQFGLEKERKLLEAIGSDPEHENSFVFINNMQREPLVPILKVILDKGSKYKLFTPEKQVNVMAK